MTPTPPEPLTQLQEGAAQLHEIFRAYVRAGFTEAQSLQLIQAIVQTGLTVAVTQQNSTTDG